MRRGVALLVILTSTAAASAPAAAQRPLRTAIFDPGAFVGSNQERAFDRSRATGATMVRISLYWKDIAPATRPPLFDAANHMNPLYNWGWFDREVQAARARGLEPYVEVGFAPPWASQGGNGTVRPDPEAFGQFARAAAARYPYIRHWLAWAEPNRDYFLMPQYDGAGNIASAHLYRDLVKHFAAGIKSVNPANRVVVGALAPLGRRGKPAPLAFMRTMLCLTRSLGRACNLRGDPVPIDIWAHHPYTLGGPQHKAGGDNVSLGDLPKLRKTLRAAIRLGHVRSSGSPPLWVTEFSWDTGPPDPKAVPMALHTRWVAEALYRMWTHGVTLATWWQIEDDPIGASRYQSGFYTVGGRAKPSLRAFRFPVVAFRRGGSVYVWGRTPTGRSGPVTVQVKTAGRWRTLGRVRANGHGIFQRTFRTGASARSSVRTRYYHEVSVPFSLAAVRNRRVEPFGCGGDVRCW